jgi:hypothetical protein
MAPNAVMLSVTNKPIILSVVILNAIMLSVKATYFWLLTVPEGQM